ncbi:hypothetical protein SETIT_9G302800v2 [Setaria italica]|uniref:VQ domain-containing protein n=1 Tax=Setaria italica TaxID=4555 RepID=K4AGP7_SETIT|nr:hypothetical protein SETIT_9G302800v2 [Setaria italica]
MANPSHDQGGSLPPAPRRSRTRRDPSGDEVYRVPPQDFAHTVQRLTGAASSHYSPTPSSSRSSLGLAAEAPPRPPSTRPPPAPALLASTPRSMQEAYMAWCASNNVVLSPGTMAEMERGRHS